MVRSPRRPRSGQGCNWRWRAWSRETSPTQRAVGGGVFEYRIDFGPGYRIYFGRDGDTLFVLLSGGTKARQQRDIEAAGHLWREYGRRKRKGD